MDKVTLEVQVRDKAVKAKHVRNQDMIPAEYYGHGTENMSLQMDYQTFRKVFRVAGENTIIELKVDGGENRKVLVQRVDYHPVTDRFEYVEFVNVRMDEKVTANVPVVLVGTAPAVKEMGGTLIQNIDEVEITCLPGDLIHEIELSVEGLVDFHSALHVSDLTVPTTVEILTDEALTIATVQAPREEEPEEVEEVDVASVEVATEKPAESEEA